MESFRKLLWPARTPKPASQQDDVYSIFYECFFLPMLVDGKLDSEEFTPLEAAFFGLGVHRELSLEVVRERLFRHIDILRHEGPPKIEATVCPRLVKAWQRRIDAASGLPKITENQREELLKWVLATVTTLGSGHELELRDREDKKFGGDGTSGSRDEKRYRSHLTYNGVGTDRPAVVEREAFTALFREIATRLKNVTEEVAGRPDTAAAAAPAQRPSAPAAAAPSDRSIVRPTAVSATSPVSAATPSQAAAGVTQEPSVSGAPVDAGSPAVSPPPDRPVPEPARVREIDVAELMQAQPGPAERQKALRERSHQLCAAMSDAFGEFTEPQRSPLAFSQHRTSNRGQVIVVPELAGLETNGLWFLGDIHGDILGLDAAVQYIDSQSPDATIVFLGDMFDDQGFGYEVVLRLFELITSRHGRIGYVVGNHDVAISMRLEPDLVFSSSVSPSDFADFLNERRGDPAITEVGKLIVRFLQAAPRAMFLPDGLIATHGGVPLGTRWEHLTSVADLEREDCLQDFTWTRAHERGSRKIPNPSSKTSQFGFDNFSAFCDLVTDKLGLKADRMIRGHDHFETCHSVYPRWVRNQCVTINTMSRRLARDPFGPFHRTPCVARWMPGKAPEIHRLTVPGNLIDAYYKPEVKPDGTGPVPAPGSA